MTSTSPSTEKRPRRSALRFINPALPGSKGVAGVFFGLSRILILLALLLFFGLPMLWLLLAPSKTNLQIASKSPISFGNFHNYWVALEHLLHYNSGIYTTWALNSLYYVAASVFLAVLMSLPAGYALAVFRFRGRKFVLIATLVALITPSAALVLPLFLEMSEVHLVNTAWSVILPTAFAPFGVYLSYIYFSTSLPSTIIESARVDGASEFRVFRSVALPLAKPLISLVAFFAFVGQWNNFFLVQVMISSEQRLNLQTGLATILSSGFFESPMAPPGILRPELAMGGLLLAAPVVIFFLLIQRYLIAGLLAGYGSS
jgi:multiple sugar transport system permease protein